MSITVTNRVIAFFAAALLLLGMAERVHGQTYDVTFTSNVTVGDDLSVASQVVKSSGTFVIDHPQDPGNKLLYHSFVESPDVKNLYDGIATLDEKGEAVVVLPGYFEALNRDFRYQLRPIGTPMPNLHIKEEVAGNRFAVGGGEPGGRVSWQVTGVRQDAYALDNLLVVEKPKKESGVVEPGEYLFEGSRKPGFFGSLRDYLASWL